MTTKKPSGHSHGFRHKSRSALTKDAPRGVAFLMREYHVGEQALVIIDPRQHKSLPHRRYHGKVGTITARSEEHTSELQSPWQRICRLLLEKKNSMSLPSSSVPKGWTDGGGVSRSLRL